MYNLKCSLTVWIVTVYLYLYGVAARQTDSTPTLLREDEIKVLLDKHNEYRRKVEPAGSNIRLLSWDDKLAGRAQAYSNKCKFSHSSPSLMDPYGFIGESIYIRNNHALDAGNIARVVQAWDEEKNYYDFNTNTCDPDRECGHYTQTVWDDTYKVGCGKTMCNGTVKAKARNYQNPTIVVCKYGPAGNVKPLFFPKPRKPYTEGDWCSDCPDEAPICVSRLCSDSKPVEAEDPTTKSTTTSTTKPLLQTKPTWKTTTKNSVLKTLLPKERMLSANPSVQTSGATQTFTLSSASTTVTTENNPAKVGTSHSTQTIRKTITFSAPYNGLRCFACGGGKTTEECVKLNQRIKCSPENITSLDMLAQRDKPWSCAKYKEANLVKMKCILSSECKTLNDVSCCETDFCNNARKPYFARFVLFIVLALQALNELLC